MSTKTFKETIIGLSFNPIPDGKACHYATFGKDIKLLDTGIFGLIQLQDGAFKKTFLPYSSIDYIQMIEDNPPSGREGVRDAS